MTRGQDHIRALTSVRFFFAAIVLVFHSSPLLERAGLGSHGWLANFVNAGYVGVQFFFVLSGFILTYTYTNLATPGSLRSFWRSRFARVYPVFVLGLLSVLPFQVYALASAQGAGPASFPRFMWTAILQATLTQAWSPTAVLSWNPPGWSLSVEAFFYLLFPLLLGGLSRARSLTLIAVALFAFFLSQGMSFVAELFFMRSGASIVPPVLADAEGRYWHNLFTYNPLMHLPAFVVGIVAGLLVRRHSEAMRPYAGWFIYGSLTIIAFTLFLIPNHSLMFHNGGLMVPAALLFVGLALHNGSITKLLSKDLAVQLGQASYAMYILHIPIFLWMSWVSRSLGIADSERALGYFVIYFLVVVFAAVIVFRTIEEPMRVAIRKPFLLR